MVLSRDVRPFVNSYCVTIVFDADRRELSIVALGAGGGGQHRWPLLSTSYRLRGGFTHSICQKLYDIWGRWHLNATRPGTSAQMEYLRSHPHPADYEAICRQLESAGLLVDHGYRYGTGFCFEEVPEEVLKFLFELPGIGADYGEVAAALFDPASALDDLLRLLLTPTAS